MGFIKNSNPTPPQPDPDVRRSQVEKVKTARGNYVAAGAREATRQDRAQAAAVLTALLRTSTPAEVDQGYTEHWLS